MALYQKDNGTHRVTSCDIWLSINSLDDKSRFLFALGPSRSYEPRQLGRHWEGHEVRFDEQGRKWTRSINRLVVDDFGTLVEVPA